MIEVAEGRLRRRYPLRGAWIGAGTGLLFLLIAVSSDGASLDELGLSGSDLAMLYVAGGLVGGILGGILWPYQRTRLETLVFALPTAAPVYLLAGFAMGLSIQVSLWAAFASSLLYSLFYGGGHTASDSDVEERVDQESRDGSVS